MRTWKVLTATGAAALSVLAGAANEAANGAASASTPYCHAFVSEHAVRVPGARLTVAVSVEVNRIGKRDVEYVNANVLHLRTTTGKAHYVTGKEYIQLQHLSASFEDTWRALARKAPSDEGGFGEVYGAKQVGQKVRVLEIIAGKTYSSGWRTIPRPTVHCVP